MSFRGKFIVEVGRRVFIGEGKFIFLFFQYDQIYKVLDNIVKFRVSKISSFILCLFLFKIKDKDVLYKCYDQVIFIFFVMVSNQLMLLGSLNFLKNVYVVFYGYLFFRKVIIIDVLSFVALEQDNQYNILNYLVEGFKKIL